jgi:hypothetical protein
MHELRISHQEFADTVDFPKPRGGMDIDDCAARDEIVRKSRAGAIEDAEAILVKRTTASVQGNALLARNSFVLG